MAKIHRIGEPENRSEAKAIRVLGETLPDNYFIFHNFELTTGRGLPYEYDIVIVGSFAVWHVEVKGYSGLIRGDQNQWEFLNGGVTLSPIPLANKKSKILASKLERESRVLRSVWVETAVLLTDDRAQVRLNDDQAGRVIHLKDAFDHFTDPSKLPVRTDSIEHLQDEICRALFGARPSQKVKRIGLYDIIEKLNQRDTRTVFLGKHRYIRTRPQTVLKVFHFDVYSKEAERERQIEAIFHDQNAMRLVGNHPNLIDTGDMFAWDDNKFVLPTEFVEGGITLKLLLERGVDQEIPWERKAWGISQMAEGLRHCHANGVIHRDIRPLNVVVAPSGVVKLVNFDLALIKDSPQVHEPKGLLQRLDRRFAAPEVLADPATASRRSDIYSLGLVFYQLITSEPAYSDPDEMIAAKAKTAANRDKLLAELSKPGGEDYMASPGDAADVICRMCRLDPAARYGSVEEVIEDLTILREE